MQIVLIPTKQHIAHNVTSTQRNTLLSTQRFIPTTEKVVDYSRLIPLAQHTYSTQYSMTRTLHKILHFALNGSYLKHNILQYYSMIYANDTICHRYYSMNHTNDTICHRYYSMNHTTIKVFIFVGLHFRLFAAPDIFATLNFHQIFASFKPSFEFFDYSPGSNLCLLKPLAKMAKIKTGRYFKYSF